MSGLQGKKIWITGASSGIGHACVLRLAETGVDLAISGRNLDKLTQLEKAIKLLSPDSKVCIAVFDVTDRQANLEAASKINAALGGIDIVFLNAGGSQHGDIKQFDSALYERSIEVNYLSLVYGVEAVLPFLRESSAPQLIGMSSVAAYGGMPRSEAYCAAKAAARNFLQGLSADLHAEKIPVSIVCPGFVKTPLTDKNDFPMPFIISVDEAASIIVKGIEKQSGEIHFPKKASVLLKLLNTLPTKLYTKIMAKCLLP